MTSFATNSTTWNTAATRHESLPSGPVAVDRRTRIASSDLVDLTSQLAIMLRSGVDVATAMQSLANQCRRPQIARVLDDVHDSVVGGATFSQSLARYPRVFDEAYVATVAAGEATGKMPEVLSQLADLQRGELRLARSIRGLLIYPILLLVVSTAVIGALLTFVLPRFAELFARYDTPLPILTQILIAIASELRGRWFIWGPLALAAVAGIIASRLMPRGRRAWDWLFVHGILIRDVSRTLLIGRACRLIGLMMENGVTLLDSVRLARASLGNSLYRDVFDDIDDAITNGRTLSSALEATDIVPPSAVEMLSTAERTGKLGEVARIMGTYFQEDGENRTRQTVAVLEPAITVLMGAIVAMVVLAVMLPVFELTSFAGKSH